jgi:hypothetical protein
MDWLAALGADEAADPMAVVLPAAAAPGELEEALAPPPRLGDRQVHSSIIRVPLKGVSLIYEYIYNTRRTIHD